MLLIRDSISAPTATTVNLWHEILAKRGSTRIKLPPLEYIVNNIQPLTSSEHAKLIVWSK